MRSSGILMPVFSLASPYGIGTFGREAYEFVDFLKKAGQRYWQLLPLNPTNYGDSPYQSFSAAAGNPYFIDLRLLTEDGLLQPADYERIDFGTDPTAVDYGKLYRHRPAVLRRAFARFRPDAAFAAFCAANAQWLSEYTLFMAIKDAHGGVSWREWERPLRHRDPAALAVAREQYAQDMQFYAFLQYTFYRQWHALKAYANAQGIRIIGDMPIYVADDSVDVWAHTENFELTEDLTPRVVAGCPPDAFCEDGQLWGMPVYDWTAMAAEDEPYSWWRWRMRHALTVYDVVRIDHFRGFEAYYCIPYGADTAKDGVWRTGPGMALFRVLQADYAAQSGEDNPAMPIIAEDLGFLTPQVKQLLADTGFPGMKVMQFAFDSREGNNYLPHHYPRNCVVYTGTHDNDTIVGWAATAAPEDVAYARQYLHVDDTEGFHWAMIRAAMMSVADTAIFMLADFWGLDSTARINVPSTVGDNWRWRVRDGCINDALAAIIREHTVLYGRAPREE